MDTTPRHADDRSDEGARISTLQRLTARLARITSSAEVASFVLHEGVSQLGATSGSLCLVSGNDLELAASAGYPENVLDTYGRFALDANTPAGECALTGVAVYCESIEELYGRYPIFRYGPIVGDPSFAVLPLEASDASVLGTFVVGFGAPRAFAEADRELLEAIAREASVALERARANEALQEARAEAEEARDRLSFLADASARLSASLDLGETLATINELAVGRIADRCAIYLLDDSGVIAGHVLGMELSAPEQALFDWQRPSLADATGVGAVIRTGHGAFVADVAAQVLEERTATTLEADLLRHLGIGGTCIVPLPVRGETIGALAFVNGSGRAFTVPERALGDELASRAAVAIDNARLFAREVRIAATLQHALLPELPTVAGIEIVARYLPGVAGEDVGGDWYDVINVDPRRCTFVVGDVSGRGLRAATTMAALRFAARAYIALGDGPCSVLDRLDRLLDFSTEHQFATVLVGDIDLETREVVLASAGHLTPLVVGPSGAAFVDISPAPPLGLGTRFPIPSARCEIPEGGTLLAYTDGLVERRGEHLDIGLERLRSAAERGGPRLDLKVDRVLADLGARGASDDVVLLALRWRAPAPTTQGV